MGEESGKMASLVIYLTFIIFSGNHCVKASPPTYTLHYEDANFEQARALCSPGVLTTLATKQEVTKILQLISEKSTSLGEATFWIGLKKAKDGCVFPSLPLRGFHWTEDGSKDSEVIHWDKEPSESCITARCATLKVQLDGSATPKWGLVAVSCRNTSVYPFICKRRERDNGGPDLLTPEPQEPGSSGFKPEPDNPTAAATRRPDQLKPSAPGQRILYPAEILPATTEHHEPKAPTPEPGRPEPDQEVNLELNIGPSSNSTSGSGPGVWSNDCQNPIIPGSRSLSPDPNNSSRILVECWSTVRVELRCQGHPGTWHLLTDAVADFSTLCKPCSVGFHKDISGLCEDVDECSSAPCRHTCLNTRGSYRCVCYDESGNPHEEGSTDCKDTVRVEEDGALSGIWIPVLIAVGALFVLVVIVVVIVKCCLMSKKKGKKEQENESRA